MSNYRNLAVWHRAVALSVEVHLAARRFPNRGAPGLKSQLLRSIASIPANIAEGAGQSTEAQFSHFVSVAIGSCNEAETHFMLAKGLDLLGQSESQKFLDELDQIRRMLFGLRKHLRHTVENPRERQ